MEPVGWVSCGCGKGVTLYARKQQAKAAAEKVVNELTKTELLHERDECLERRARADAAAAADAGAATDPKQQRLCAWCGKPYKDGRKYVKCCTWSCYLKKKEQRERMAAVTALGSSAALPLEPEPDETEEEAKTQPDV